MGPGRCWSWLGFFTKCSMFLDVRLKLCLRRKLLQLEGQPLEPLSLAPPEPSKGSGMLAARAKERHRLPWIDLRSIYTRPAVVSII